ncbi:MAG: hypothetical protein LBI42_05455 [Chitinispirillales bacterium]|jgi:ribonuclease D|nr:hypothetical protein [Chitinispirillales bacterium]
MHSAAGNLNTTQIRESVEPKTNIDRIITTEEELNSYLDSLRKRQVKKIALDLEGDQGSFRYKYSISIFQCFDGEESVVIDVLRMGNNSALKEFLTCGDITKVMFSFSNDVFMTQNVLGCTISPVNDIAAAQKLLGLPVNLANYLNIDKDKKDGFQRANWLIRPIKPELLEYAINDVLKLLDIEHTLAAQLIEENLYGQYIASAKAVSERNFIINQHCQYQAKFPGYLRMPYGKKRQAALLWIFRELLGEKINCPVGYILSKKAMKNIVNGGSDLLKLLEIELNRGRRRERQISMQVINMLFDKAMQSPYLPSLNVKKKHRDSLNLKEVN